jgi:hypothetical protein
MSQGHARVLLRVAAKQRRWARVIAAEKRRRSAQVILPLVMHPSSQRGKRSQRALQEQGPHPKARRHVAALLV